MKTIEGQQFITLRLNAKEVYKIDYGKSIPTIDVYNFNAVGAFVSLKDDLPDLGDEINGFFMKEVSYYMPVHSDYPLINIRLRSSALYIWSEFGGEISILRH